MSSTGHLSELDLLRSQVADLSRQLAERDRSTQDLREQSALLRAIAEGTAAETGEEFFASLVTHLTSVLHVQYAIIGEVQGDRIKKIRTLAVSAGGVLVDNFEYELAHTPCATALTETFAYFDRDLQATFPQFQRLADLGAESYCSVPFRTKGGAVIGLLVVMDTKPLEHSDDLQSLLVVFAPRIAAEFERRRAEQERAQALADLHNVIEAIPDIVFALNIQGNMVKWNRRVVDVTGYSPEELLNKPALAFVPPEEQTHTATAIQRAFTEGYAELEGHLLTKDHRLIPYHWTGALLKNSHGEPIGITGIGRDVSDKKQAEEALRESEERLALAVEGSSDVLWDAHRLPGEPWYAPETPVWWSPRVRELLGLEESGSFETLEQWAARLHPDDKDRVFGQLAAHIEHRVPYDVEYRLRNNAGNYLWIRGRGQALWDEQGEPRRMSGSCQDITKRKRTEELLRISEARFRSILQHEPECVKTVAPDGTLLMMNPAGLSMVGARGEEEVIGQSILSLIYPEDRAAFQELHQAVCNGASGALQFRVRTLQGEVRWMDTQSVPLREGEGEGEGEGEVTAILSITHDITKRKRAAEALHEMNLALTNAMPGISRVSPDGRYLEVNEAYAGALGYDLSELIGEEAFRAVHPDDRPRMEAAHATMLQEGKGEFEALALRKDGTSFWKQALMVKIADPEGRYLGHHCFMRDITKRKQFEAMRARQYEALQAIFNMTVALSRASSLEEVYEQGIDGVQRALKVDRASILLFDDDGVMRFKASRGLSKGYIQAVEGHSPWPREAVNPPPICVADMEEDPSMEAYRGIFRAERIQALGFIPLWSSDGLLGKFMLYYDSPHQFTEEEIQVAQTIAGHIAFMIQRKRAETTVRLTQFSVDHAVEGFFWIGPDARIFHVNDSACRMLEYTWEELTTMTLHDIDPNLSSEVWPAQWEELKEKGSLTFESKYWSRTGRVLDMEVTVNYLQYEGKEYNCAIMRDIGERRRADAALRASEERYRVLYDETPTMYFTLAMDGTVLSVNRFGAEQLGYRAEELIGHSVLGIFHEGDKETVAASLAECLATPEITRHWEFRKRRKDGSVMWVRESARVGQSSTGDPVVLVTCEDVTERRRTVQALTFFRTLLDYVDDSIEIIDPQTGQFLDGNRGAAANIGYTRDEFLALTVPDIDPLVTGPVFAGVVERLREAPDPIILDSIHRRKDGTTFPVEVSAQLIQLDKEYLVAIVRDITERKRVEEALRLAKFSMDRASDAVYWIDPQAKILDVNEAASSMLGYSKDELCAMTVHDLNPDFPADMWPGFWTETQRRGTMVLETAHRAKNGRLIPVEVSVNYLSHEGKEYHCAFVRNITERKQVEQEQACLIEDLTRSQQHFQTLFNWTPSAVGISTAAEGRFINVNEGFSRLTGYTREEVIGRTTSELGLWADPSERESVLREILKQGYLHNWEGLLRTKSGEIRSLMVSIHSIKLGPTPCLIYLGHDITERKRMEDALRQRERDLRAAIEERERISQDLHDGILQSLFAVGLTLEVSKSMMSTRVRKTSGASLNQAIDQLNDVMREIRNFIAGLGSDLLQGKDFSATVKHMLALLTQNQATRVRLAVEDRAAKAVSVEQSLHLFRVIQEAVSNCIRHGHAQEARVSLKMLKQGVRLSIRDNGRGFNPKAAKGTGHGLRNMAARAEKFGGRFTVLSKVNAGTRIVLDLPKEVSDVPR